MERQANFAVVGAISIALIIGAFVFVVWLAKFQFNQKYDEYRTIFHGPVSGLSKGGAVQFNGIKVGEITKIELDQLDANKVVVDLQVEDGTPVRMDSTVQAASQGITGVKYLQISPGSVNRPLLMKGSRERPPVIPSRRGKLDEVVNDLGKLTANGAEALDRVNRVLSDGNIQTMTGTLDNVQALTAEFRARKSMFANMDSALTKLDGAAGQLQSLLASTRGALGDKDRGALAELSGASTELRAAATNMRTLVARLDGPVSEVSTATVPALNATINSIQQAAERLDNLTLEIQRDPHALISSRSAKELEIPQ